MTIDHLIAFGGVFLLGIAGFIVSMLADKAARQGERDQREPKKV
jgi:hypothetical protein